MEWSGVEWIGVEWRLTRKQGDVDSSPTHSNVPILPDEYVGEKIATVCI